MENNNENTPLMPQTQESPLLEQKSPETIYQPETNASYDNQSPIEVKKKKSISLKTVIIIVIILVIFGAVYYFKGLLIAATVNGSPISRFAVISKLEKSAGKSTLEMLITMKIIDDEALKKNITVTDEEINNGAKKVEDQIKAQGLTLEEALTQQGITMADFRNQMRVQLELEKLLGDKIAVSDEEVSQYITDNKLTAPEGQEESFKEQTKSQLKQQKININASEYIDALKAQAKIKYFVKY